MPTYDYVCRNCDHEFELFQSMSAPVKRKCPECGKLKLERLIGIGSAVIFKGSGFYETDYRSESYKTAEKKEKDGAKPKKKDDASGKDGSSTKKDGSKVEPSKAKKDASTSGPASGGKTDKGSSKKGPGRSSRGDG